MTTYFGNEAITGTWGDSNGNNAFGSLYTCPGTGDQYVESLEAYLKNTGRVRLAIYSADLSTLICQGYAQATIGSSAGWIGHTIFADKNGKRIIPVLQGGTNYYLVHCYDYDPTNQLWNAGGSHKYGIGGRDYTDTT